MNRMMSTILVGLLSATLASCTKKTEGEKGHAHAEKGHDEHGEEGHDHGEEKGHGEGEEGHDEGEEGVVELSEKAAANVTLVVQPVERRSLSGLIATTGTVDFDPGRVAHIGARLSGRLQQTKVELGDQVKAGDLLAIIDSVELGKDKSEYLQAKARTVLARQTLEREEKLAKEQITSQ